MTGAPSPPSASPPPADWMRKPQSMQEMAPGSRGDLHAGQTDGVAVPPAAAAGDAALPAWPADRLRVGTVWDEGGGGAGAPAAAPTGWRTGAAAPPPAGT